MPSRRCERRKKGERQTTSLTRGAAAVRWSLPKPIQTSRKQKHPTPQTQRTKLVDGLLIADELQIDLAIDRVARDSIAHQTRVETRRRTQRLQTLASRQASERADAATCIMKGSGARSPTNSVATSSTSIRISCAPPTPSDHPMPTTAPTTRVVTRISRRACSAATGSVTALQRVCGVRARQPTPSPHRWCCRQHRP